MTRKGHAQKGEPRIRKYFANLGEAWSQLLNVHLGGTPNQTYSARIASKRDTGAAWYWEALIWIFELGLPGHLDSAAGPDGE